MAQSKAWCVTWNIGTTDMHPTEDMYKNMKASYAIAQLERGATGNLHYQMYLEFNNKVYNFIFIIIIMTSLLLIKNNLLFQTLSYNFLNI